MSNLYPSDWSYGELAKSGVDILDGDRGKEYPKETDFFENEYCLFLSAKNVTKSGFKFDHKAFITREKDEKLRKGKLIRNDLVVTTRGTVGNVAYFDGTVPFENIRINSGMAIIRNVDSQIDSIFLNQLLHSFIVDEQLELLTSGSAQPQLTIGTIKGLVIPFPPLPEQQKIAKILTSVDEVVEKTQAQIDKLKDLKTGMMQELLTNGIGHTEFKDSPVGRIPAEWKVKTISNLGSVVTGNTPKTSNRDNYAGDIPFISPADIDNSMYIFNTKSFISEVGIKQTRELPKGSVCVVCIGSTIGKTGLTVARCASNQQINSIICDSTYPEFVYYLMTFYSSKIKAEAGTQAVPIINKSLFSAIEVQVPTYREQIEIGNALASVDEKLTTLNLKRLALQNTKKALMQDLLTGKVRVKTELTNTEVAVG
jgi:type I restriction enzyme S subunit